MERRRSLFSNGSNNLSNDPFYNQYLTIESLEDGNTISYYISSSNNISYSTNKVTWTTKSSSGNNTLATLNTGDKLYVKHTGSNGSNSSYSYFSSTKNFKVYGNLLSMNYGDNFTDPNLNMNYYANKLLFYNCTKLVDVSNLVISAKEWGLYCCYLLFYNCKFTDPPKIYAESVDNYSCYYMFGSCTSLTIAPELPATTLGVYCYQYMFLGCTALTTAPELPATTLSTYCYSGMFQSCTALVNPPEMLATTLDTYCCNNMFYGCTSLTKSPVLLAETMKNNSYNLMFMGCTNLSEITCFAKSVSSSYCKDWVKNVAATGTFTVNQEVAKKGVNSIWATGTSGIPSGWTTNITGYEDLDFFEQYLTFESLEDDNQITFKHVGNTAFYVLVSTNLISWTSKTSTTSGVLLATLNLGDKLYLKYLSSFSGTSSRYGTFLASKDFKAYGNIMSIAYGTSYDNGEFPNNTTFYYSSESFYYLFKDNIHLKDISNLVFPATNLNNNVYAYMFYGCTGLTNASFTFPEWSITPSLSLYACLSMFEGCTSLVNPPILPKKICIGLYLRMFYGCTSLIKAPDLLAPYVPTYAYKQMFYDCTNLNLIKCMASEMLGSGVTLGTYLWTNNVSASGTFTKGDLTSFTWSRDANGIPSGWTINNMQADYSGTYFTIESLSDNNTIKLLSSSSSGSIYISINNAAWTSKSVSYSNVLHINDKDFYYYVNLGTLNTGDTLRVYATISNSSLNISNFVSFYSTDDIKVYGNVASLVCGQNFHGATLPNNDYMFNSLFYYCEHLKDALYLVIPEVPSSCNYAYYHMFEGCSGLTIAPYFTFTTLTKGCCAGMFMGCTSLTVAPALPFTTLAPSCYEDMFKDCTSLTTMSELPATTLAYACYHNMFQGCTSLVNVSSLPATNLVFTYNYAYNESFQYGVYEGMFNNCTSLTTAPNLPATILSKLCYKNMFLGCTSLVNPPTLPARNLEDNCYESMFAECTSLMEAPNLLARIIKNCSYKTMFRNCTNLNKVKCYAFIYENDSLNGWLYKVSKIGTFIKIYEAAFLPGVDGIPTSWNILNEDGEITLEMMYFYIESEVDDNRIGFYTETEESEDTEYYINVSSDGCAWRKIIASPNDGNGTEIAVLLSKLRLFIKGNNITGSSRKFVTSGNFSIGGNILSLVYGSLFYEREMPNSAFNSFFSSSKVVDASNLVIPCTSLQCCSGMFGYCTSLIAVPVLPATTLANNCYSGMFYNCTALTAVPLNMLPATTLAQYCYYLMFYNCESLINSPELPATTLAYYCYQDMFHDCEKLEIVPEELPATTLTEQCYRSMFSNCESLTIAPKLPAKELVSYCYDDMFYNCRSLKEIVCLATNPGSLYSTDTWVYLVPATGTFYKDANTTWTSSNSGIPSGWTIVNYVEE